MSKSLSLELPGNLGLAPEVLRSLNDRFLRIAEGVQASLAGGGAAQQGAHVLRLDTAAVNQQAGNQFWELDRQSIYIARTVGRTLVWSYAAGMYGAPRASRPQDLGKYDAGFLFWTTDQTILYRWSGTAWTYVSGTMRDTLANRPAPEPAEEGMLFYVMDYHHTVRWTGSSWEWAPGDDGSDYFRYARGAQGTGWALCDGSAVRRLKSDLTTEVVTLPDLTAGAYLKGGAYTGSVTAAGTISLSGNTGNTSGGTPSGSISVESAHTHAIDHDHPSATSGSNSSSNGFPIGTLGTVTVASHPHTHTVDLPALAGSSGAGSAHNHALTGDALAAHHHDLSAAGATLTGDPVKNLATAVYYRL